AIAYDPLTDTFWSGNFGDPIAHWDRDGNVLDTFDNPGVDFYGLAFDPDDPEGPFLYAFHQSPGCTIIKIDPETFEILETVDVTDQGGDGAIAGGLCYMNDWDPALRTLGALLQGAPDYICVYELGENAPAGAPGAPEMFTVTPDPNGGLTADLGWMNPTETVSGETLTDLDEMGVFRGGELIHTISNPVIGGVENWTDNLPEAGFYGYTVIGFNDEGVGVGASDTAYIGEDVPAAVTSITLANVDGNGELSWANPTAGLHGGPFNEPIEGYHIVRSDGEEFEPTGIMTTWTDDSIPEEGLYAYTITPYNSIGDGGSASSEMTWIGDSQAAMFGDPNTTTMHYYTPIDFWYRNSLSQTIYYADEFAAQGFGGGAITAIMYYNNFVDDLPGMPINIWMQNTTLENLSGGWESATDMTQVYSGTLDFPIGVNEIMVDLDDPFIYEGQNLIVFVERVMDTVYYSTGDTFYYTDTQYTDRCLWAQSDSDDYDPYNPPTTINYLSSNPNTMMFINTTGLGQMEGYAYNTDTNEPLEGVLIELMEQRIHTFTDANGHYSFPGLFEGTYEAHATLFAHSEDIETVIIVADETTDQDFYLQPVPEVEVTGRVVGSDYPDIGLADAVVTLSGMGVHEGITDEDGYFNINTVYASNTYQLVVVAEGYEVLVGEAIIGAGNTDLGDLVVNEIAFPAYDVIATQNEDDTVVDLIWHGPNPAGGNFWDFESDDGEFVANMGWAWGTDTMAGAYSGDNVWGTTLNAQYPNSVSYELVTPEMNIPTDDAVLTFWHWMDIETNYDGGNIKVSTDGGTSWTLITPVGGYPGTAYGLNSEACFNGYGQTWTLVTFEIGAYQGEDVMLKFHFGSDSSITYQGWYIDDVYVGMPEDRLMHPNNPNFHPIANLLPHNNERIIENYNIYLLLMGEEENEENWETIATAVEDTVYSDPTWADLESEIYKYAVKAEYTNNVLADPAISNWVGKDMIATLEVTLTTNVGDIPAGATVYLEATEPDPVGDYPEYSGITDENGECTIIGIWKSNYDLIASYPGFSTLTDNIDILENVVTYTGMIYEEANSPYDVLAEVNVEDTECDLIWNSPGSWPSYEIIYDDDEAENATAWYDADNERALWFTAQGGPCMVSGGSMHIYDGTWPAGNILTPFTAAVWAYDEATGMPGEMLGSVLVTPTDYFWVSFEFDEPIAIDGTEFFLGYLQGGAYPDCAGIGIDETPPTMGRSYEHYVTGGTPWAFSGYQDFMLRAIVMGPTGRQLTASYDNPVVDFSNIIPHKGAIGLHASNQPRGIQEVGSARYNVLHNIAPLSSMFSLQSGINSIRDRELLGYNVILGEYGDEPNWSTWEQVNTEMIEDTIYTDVNWVDLESGTIYTYGVRAVYTNNNQSEPAFSNWVGKDMFTNASVSVYDFFDNPVEEATVKFTCQTPDPDEVYHEYELLTDANGEVYFPQIWKSIYNIRISKENMATYELEMVS
ncbi:MAG: immune inhibitor A, partial [Candidatus Stygibacter australis]|nr:immune inhibitor A [Candidatus Stygibacter australis]